LLIDGYANQPDVWILKWKYRYYFWFSAFTVVNYWYKLCSWVAPLYCWRCLPHFGGSNTNLHRRPQAHMWLSKNRTTILSDLYIYRVITFEIQFDFSTFYAETLLQI
jgi:hypothetical protein